MKKILVVAVGLGFVALTSCNKCHECHYESVDASGVETEVELGEYCGDELEDIEASGYQVNDSTTVDVHCHEH